MTLVAKRFLRLSAFVAVAFVSLSGRNSADMATSSSGRETMRADRRSAAYLPTPIGRVGSAVAPKASPNMNSSPEFPQVARNVAEPSGDRMSDFRESAKTVVSTSTRSGFNSAHEYFIGASEPTILFMFGAALVALSLALRSKRAS
jgi:hypothetical protein